MADSVVVGKRTRSQLTLPDDILKVPQQSPMKGARSALKNQAMMHDASSSQGTESDDELLLSPNKKDKAADRSGSDTHGTGEAEGSRVLQLPSPSARASKRRKRDLQETHEDSGFSTEFGALRSLTPTQDSRLSPSHQLTRKRSSPHKPTRSVSPTPSVSLSPSKDRAKSVPPFAASNSIPHIDFRDGPPSPSRSKSRSPSKERLRIVQGAFPSSNTFGRPTESRQAMDIDRPPPHTAASSEPSSSSNDTPTDIPPTPIPSRNSNNPIPFTPATSSSLDAVMPLSPLTPVPPTPMPTQAATIQDRMNKQSFWKSGMPTLQEDEPNTQHQEQPVPSTSTNAEALDKLIPMSPLTPVPPTPFPPPKQVPAQSRFAGWRLEPVSESSVATGAPGPSKSTLDKNQTRQPSMGPPTTIPSKTQSKGYLKATFASNKGGAAASGSQASQKTAVNETSMAPGKYRSSHTTAKAKELGTTLLRVANKTNARAKMKPRAKTPGPPPASDLLVPEEHDEAEKPRDGTLMSYFAKKQIKTSREVEGKEIAPILSGSGSAPEPVAEPVHIAESMDMVTEQTPTDTLPSSVSLPPVEPAAADSSLETVPPAETSTEEPPPSSPPLDQEDVPPSSPLAINEVSREQHDEPQADPSQDQTEDNEAMQTDDPVPEAGPSTAVTEEPSPASQLPSTMPGKKVSRKPSLNAVKRVPSTGSLPSRVTRSVSSRANNAGVSQVTAPTEASRRRAASTSAASRAPAAGAALKRTASGAALKGHRGTAASAIPADDDNAKQVPEAGPSSKPATKAAASTSGPASPAKPSLAKPNAFPSSPVKPTKAPDAGSSNLATPAKSPAKSRIPIPSPTKITRTTSTVPRPVLGLGRTFAIDTIPATSSSSSLSTLSNALDRLRNPAPLSRPNTSMGFNPNSGEDNDEVQTAGTKDDSGIWKASSSKPVSSSTSAGAVMQRSVTLGSTVGGKGAKKDAATSAKAGASGPKPLVQKTPGSFMTGGKAPASRGPFGPGKSTFVGVMLGARPRVLASKKSSLPVVIGSPVKGGRASAGDGDVTMREEDDSVEIIQNNLPDEDIFMAPPTATPAAGPSTAAAEPGTDLVVPLSDSSSSSVKDKGKAKERSISNNSRRVSMLSQSLSQSRFAANASESSPPGSTAVKGDMGPPPTPPKRGNSSSPSAASSTRGGSSSPSSRAGPAPAVRSSSRLATRTASEASIAASSSRAASSSARKDKGKEKEKDGDKFAAAEAKGNGILKDCRIFVDVRTDGGEDAGGLFSEMLETMGARLLTRVGSTCTHIVFKNGLTSTLSRYRALDEPKPHVVGIGWVVACVEQKTHSDEAPFAVDVTHMNVAGTHKRRRSVLPKLAAELAGDAPQDDVADGDVSMDGSQSSLTLDEDLPPLERARRRKMMSGGT